MRLPTLIRFSKKQYRFSLLLITFIIFVIKSIHIFSQALQSNESTIKRRNSIKTRLNFDLSAEKPNNQEENKIIEQRNQEILENQILPSISATLLVRIYADDKAFWSKKELTEWVHYMFFAGIKTLYIYDHYLPKNKDAEKLESFINQVLIKYYNYDIVYHDWSEYHPYSMENTQIRAYQHAVENYGKLAEMMMNFDMDEYIYSSLDKDEGFLPRMVKYTLDEWASLHKNDFSPKTEDKALSTVAELSIKNFIFHSQEETKNPDIFRCNNYSVEDFSPQKNTWLIETIFRRDEIKSNKLDKPIFYPSRIKEVKVHHEKSKSGYYPIEVNPNYLRNNHYWGYRLLRQGKWNANEIVGRTKIDQGVFEIVEKIRELEDSEFLQN